MNIVKIDGKLYKYESFWRSSNNKKTNDYENNPFPWPESKKNKSSNWESHTKEVFLTKLKETQTYLIRKNKFIKYLSKQDYKNCLICNKKNITTGMFEINNIRWEEGLYHYIKNHNIKPSEEFIDFIFRHDVDPSYYIKRNINKVTKIKTKIVVDKNKKYLKIDKNQIMIMDALMVHGSKKNYIDDNRQLIRYSEHAGLIDFNDSGLEKLIISGNTTRVDPNDDEIFLPQEIADAYDYEYIFHTHPATPTPGGRSDVGILYEFPSVSDLFHFIDHYNDGKTQGSLIVAAEGLYNIRKTIFNSKKINVDEDKLFNDIRRIYSKLQDDAIEKYGTDFSNETFYSKIAQNKSYIDRVNKVLNKYDMNVDFYSRVKTDKNKWIIDTIYLPIFVIEPKRTSRIKI